MAPAGLDQNTGTAEIFRLPEVRAAIRGDFVVLPCDIVCELGGEALLETWMVRQGGIGGATGGGAEFTGPKMAVGGEKGGRRGGLGVWYQTKGEAPVKGEETDFIATTALEPSPVPPAHSSLLLNTSKLVYATPTDTLNDITEEKKSVPLRHSLIQKHGRLRMLSSHRDAHIYIFPSWVLDMINVNERMDSLSEDVIGWWAKAGWQEGLGDKLGMRDIFHGPEQLEGEDPMVSSGLQEEEIDVGNLSSTRRSDLRRPSTVSNITSDTFAARTVPAIIVEDNARPKLTIPPILAYVHPSSKPSSMLIRRVDTAPLLLSVSLQLAKLGSIEELGRAAASPFAHTSKVAHVAGVAARCTVTRPDCLLAENVTVDEKCSIKECVIGTNCRISEGAKLTRCVLMDGVVVGKGCKLTGCILGRRSEIGAESILQDCEVQENLIVDPGSKFPLLLHFKDVRMHDQLLITIPIY